MTDNAILGSLGISDDEEAVYRTLLQSPHATLSELIASTSLPATRLRRHLSALERLGLLTRSVTRPVRFAPTAPDAAIEVLARQRQEEIEQARLAATMLAQQFRVTTGDASAVATVRGQVAIIQQWRRTHRTAAREVLTLDYPAYREQLRRGITYRTIYDQSALDGQETLTRARELVLHGEQARVLDGLPLRLAIADRAIGLVPLAPLVSPGERELLVIQPSALLDGLVALFEALWERATPLWPSGARVRALPELTDEDELLLALSAAGLTDEAIARRLGVAQRTVERRMRRVMTLLHAKTRFQAGLRAARLGIIGS